MDSLQFHAGVGEHLQFHGRQGEGLEAWKSKINRGVSRKRCVRIRLMLYLLVWIFLLLFEGVKFAAAGEVTYISSAVPGSCPSTRHARSLMRSETCSSGKTQKLMTEDTINQVSAENKFTFS